MADEWKIQIAEVGVLYFFLISAGRGGRYTGGRAAVTTFLTSSGVLSGEEGDWRGWRVRRGESGAAKYCWQFVLTAPCFLYVQSRQK